MKIVDRIFNTVLTADDSTEQEELGSFRFEDGNIYKYVQFKDSITAIEGAPVLLDGTYNYKVTCDVDGGVTAVNAIVGVALTTNQPDYYGWIQIYGHGKVATTDYFTAGDLMLAHASTDLYWVKGVTVSTSACTEHKYGAVLLENAGTDATATVQAFIRCM